MRNLGDVAAYALDEAQLTGRDYGLLLQQDAVDGETVYSYQWRERALRRLAPTREWQGRVCQRRPCPRALELQLELEDSPVEEMALARCRGRGEPQVVFYASGETTRGLDRCPAQQDGELLWRLEWDLLGRFAVLPRGEEPEVE